MGTIVSINAFNGRTNEATVQDNGLQISGNRANKLAFRQMSRRMALRMLLAGLSFREAAKRHPDREDGLTRDIRTELSGRKAA